jgi:uncharacterized paraquat-inducible protein A
MAPQLEDANDWDEGCASHGCNCHNCGGHDDSDDWSDETGDDDATVPCPYCGQEMYEDSPRCPRCGQYISAEDAPQRHMPWWIILGVVLCLCVILVWVFAF